MAIFELSRGVTALLMNSQAGTGIGADSARLPMDYVGARMSFQFLISATATVKIEATLDGVSWGDFPDANVIGVTASKLVVSINQGIMGIRGNVTAFTSGTVSILARVQ